MTKDEVLQVIICALPYPDQMRNIDTTSDANGIRFVWRSQSFRVDILHFQVSALEDGMLVGNDVALLLQSLLARTWLDIINSIKPTITGGKTNDVKPK